LSQNERGVPANVMSSQPTQIKSLQKAIRILDILKDAADGMSLAEICSRIKLSKSTVHGLISTMRDENFIEQSPTDGKYKLGVRLFELGNAVARNWDVRKVALYHMKKLLADFGETVHLVKLDQNEVLYIDKLEGIKALRIVSEIGTRLPLYCTGVGKAMMAYLPEYEIERFMRKITFVKFTPNTITNLEALKRELESVRKRGYAEDNQEIMEGLTCIAAPIFDHAGNAIYAISVSGPTYRFDHEMREKAIHMVKEAAMNISVHIGYRKKRG
jgi:Transcriptional regulator